MAGNTKTSYVCVVTDAERQELERILRQQDWSWSSAPYAHWKAAKEKVNVVAYHSGKLTVQGAGTEDFVLFLLEPEVLKRAGFGYDTPAADAVVPVAVTPHGGIDESGKGDFFGPLAIAGVCVDASSAERLLKAGCRDSKTIKSDAKIAEIARAIRAAVPGCFTEVVINPPIYNALYARIGNLNRLLAWGHARVIENLLELVPECPRMLSDKFADDILIRRALLERGRRIQLDAFVRAESDIAVAAASILARDAFVRGMARLSAAAGVALKRGAGPEVKQQAREIVAANGEEALAACAKTHFRTWYEATGRPVPETPAGNFKRERSR